MEASSNCPICGFDRPHQHTSLEVAHHQGAIERKDPISFESYGMAFCEAVKGKLETGGWPTMASLIRNRAQEIQFRMNRSPKAALPVAVGAGEEYVGASYQVRSPTGLWRQCELEEYDRVAANRPTDARFLYARKVTPATPADGGDRVSELVAALRKFVREAEEVDVGGGDAVVTTCESLEAARAALAKFQPAGGENDGR